MPWAYGIIHVVIEITLSRLANLNVQTLGYWKSWWTFYKTLEVWRKRVLEAKSSFFNSSSMDCFFTHSGNTLLATCCCLVIQRVLASRPCFEAVKNMSDLSVTLIQVRNSRVWNKLCVHSRYSLALTILNRSWEVKDWFLMLILKCSLSTCNATCILIYRYFSLYNVLNLVEKYNLWKGLDHIFTVL